MVAASFTFKKKELDLTSWVTVPLQHDTSGQCSINYWLNNWVFFQINDPQKMLTSFKKQHLSIPGLSDYDCFFFFKAHSIQLSTLVWFCKMLCNCIWISLFTSANSNKCKTQILACLLFTLLNYFLSCLYFCSANETFLSNNNDSCNQHCIMLNYITVISNHSNLQFIGNIHGPYKAYRLRPVKGGANEFDYQSVWGSHWEGCQRIPWQTSKRQPFSFLHWVFKWSDVLQVECSMILYKLLLFLHWCSRCVWQLLLLMPCRLFWDFFSFYIRIC